MCQGYCMVVFENECKKTNTRSQTQKYLSLGKFTLAPLCEPHKIEIVQEKRQETFVVIVVGRHESMQWMFRATITALSKLSASNRKSS